MSRRAISAVLNLFINFFRPIPFVILITVLIPFSRF
ncbi:ABC transporter permease, partial [Methylobacterium radiotolerans]